MNIFSTLQVYAGKWAVKAKRAFTPEEVASVASAVVVASQYGNSVCFHMAAGGQAFIPLSQDATVGVGETVDLSKAELLTLGRPGDADIVRVKI